MKACKYIVILSFFSIFINPSIAAEMEDMEEHYKEDLGTHWGFSKSPQAVPEATTGFQVPFANDHYGLHYKTDPALDECSGTTYHPGVDFNGVGNDCGLDIRAVAIGVVRYANTSSWGGLVIEHNWQGQTWYSQYGHVSAIFVSVGDTVSKNQVVADVGSVGASSCHLHWEIREADHPNPTFGPYWNCTGFQSQTTIENWYENPESFVTSHGPYNSFAVQYVDQNYNTLPWLAPGQTINLWVKFRNVGSVTWQKTGGVSNPNYIELRSVDNSCNQLSSFCAYHLSWINRQRIGSFQESSVPPGSIGTFSFTAEVPSTTGTCLQYTAPWAASQCVQNWAGVSFTVRSDGTVPTNPGVPVSSPPSNNVNSFSFSWGASSDAHSGLKYYRYRINGGSISTTTSTSLPAGAYATQQGANTFEIQAEDNVGNLSAWQSVQFTWNVGGCGVPLPNCSGIPIAGWHNIEENGDLAITTRTEPVKDGYIRLSLQKSDQWSAVGQLVDTLIEPGATYRIGFSYRISSEASFGWALTDTSRTNEAQTWLTSQACMPVAFGDWRQFWSAPFSVTTEELKKHPLLLLYVDASSGQIDVLDVQLYRDNITQ